MSASMDDLKRWDREFVWHAFTQMAEYEPWLIERAEGCKLIDLDGREFIDGVSSLWCNVHGHRHPRLDAAIREQLDKVAHVTNLGMSNPTTVRLAERLTRIAPPGLRHVFFSSDGSCSVEVALKMSLQSWHQRPVPKNGKTKYLAFVDAYHGDTLGSVSVGGVARFHEMFRPLLFDVIRAPVPSTFRLPPGIRSTDAAAYYLGQVEFELARHHESIAAVVVEPLVQCAAGIVTHPAGFLRGLRDLTNRYQVHLIADEVATGFGRTGTMFACEREGIIPDFLCLGKGLTGGYLPMAATLTTDATWNAFLGSHEKSKTFFHGHTFGGNPLAAAVAIANLDVFVEDQTLDHLAPKIEHLTARLSEFRQHPHVGDIRQCGFIAGIELVQRRDTNEPYPWSEKRGMRVCDQAKTQGVWLRPLGNVIVIMPPLSISHDQLDQICDAVRDGIDAATQAP